MKAFKNPNILRRFLIITTWSALALSKTPTLFADPFASEKTVVTKTANANVFPPKAEGAGTLTVSSPVIVIDENVAAKLGGASLAKMARPSLENLLNNSGRFTVIVDGEAPYKVKATVTSLKITKVQAKKEAGASQLLKSVIPKLTKLDSKIDPDLISADWSKDELLVKVECGLTLQIVDKDSHLIAGSTGMVSRQDSTKAIRAELAGVNFSNGADQNGDGNADAATVMDVPTQLIELAAFESLKESLPAVDKEIAQRKTAPLEASKSIEIGPIKGLANEAEKNGSGITEARSTIAKPKFCGQCGQRIDGEDKFCPNCGKPLRR